MYEAPTISVLPGGFYRENRSSEVITNFSTSGIFGRKVGLPPTAITTYFAVTFCFCPFLSVSSTVWGSTNEANELKYLTSFLDNSTL